MIRVVESGFTNVPHFLSASQADQLFDFTTGEFRCTFCGSLVEEDGSALPRQDSRLLLAKFNEQLQPLYDLLREVEDIKLSPECLEPEPVDIDTIRGTNKQANRAHGNNGNEQWSGEATRNQGFAVEETRVDVTIGGANTVETVKTKDRPIWMTESTIVGSDATNDNPESILQKAAQVSTQSASAAPSTARGRKDNEDIMSVLLQHEKQPGKNNAPSEALKNLAASGNSSDSSEDERENEPAEKRKQISFASAHNASLLTYSRFLCSSNRCNGGR